MLGGQAFLAKRKKEPCSRSGWVLGSCLFSLHTPQRTQLVRQSKKKEEKRKELLLSHAISKETLGNDQSTDDNTQIYNFLHPSLAPVLCIQLERTLRIN